ncbi:periplasmic nitrate reductase chaperone NapD [Desulfurobacterium pacificum]|jgi:nitrate reductase NapD|uniref:Periplasmic nitrate reductase chaperone NapD n=1 Tax=Desulfurobacterium pacificum TaxID=240166 RepID=A0ABY1NV77_9BACT|nr:chaperone NapD [Desulfurobacterium pacificum]SMP18971.1 periplasmic nitrate reductase chaperone NapD [Desulfurobacterium pacificum]
MPIVSCVVACEPEKGFSVEKELLEIPGVEVYGSGLKEKENVHYVIVVLEGETYEDVEAIEKRIKEIDGVLYVGVVEAYFLDEYEKIEKGEIVPSNPFHGLKRSEKLAERFYFGEDEDNGKESDA